MVRNFLIVVLLFAAVTAFGQTTGRLTGTVVDPTGAAIPNVDVSLFLPGGTTAVLRTTTTSEGIFDFIGVRPDRYRLEVESPGFSKHVQGDVSVEARQITLPEIKLAVGGVTQIVEVVGAPQQLDLATAEISSTIT